jgi:hypothetical protein
MPTATSMGLNLVLTGKQEEEVFDGVTLNITGASAGTQYEYRTLNLFLKGDYAHYSLNLFLRGPLSVLESDLDGQNALNLFIMGSGTPVNKSLPLVTWGSVGEYSLSLNRLTIEQLESLTLQQLSDLPIDSNPLFTGYYNSKGLTLYIKGEGLFDGFSVSNSYLNLFLDGGKGSTKGLNLYMQGVPVPESQLPLYLQGVLGFITSIIPLYLSNKDDVKPNLDLFVRGFNP